MGKTVLGVIGGSGVYDLPGLAEARWKTVDSSFGAPSDALRFGCLHGVDMVFLPRHGRGHTQSPGSINYRANIDALKRAGVSDIISVSAAGSLRKDLSPGTFVIVDQFVDRTFAREGSFFGEGLVAHVSMADPVCPRLGGYAEAACREESIPYARGGSYVVIEGPQFSSRAESLIYRSWGCSVIGMTNMPEARLAREAEINYATIAMITDYDCWHEEEDNVEVTHVLEVLRQNAAKAQSMLDNVVRQIGSGPRTPCPHGFDRVLDMALITPPEARDPVMIRKLEAVAGRVLEGT